MRAHFAGDVVSGTSDDITEVDRIAADPLAVRIHDFKRDTENMEALAEFIDDVLHKAEVEAIKQQELRQEKNDAKNGKSSQQPKEKSRQSFTMPDFKNGKVVNRARGLVVRIFDAICNCANTAAAAPAQRLKLRGKRSASTANGSGNSVGNTEKNDETASGAGGDKAETKEKHKKQSNGNGGKDKKTKAGAIEEQ